MPRSAAAARSGASCQFGAETGIECHPAIHIKRPADYIVRLVGSKPHDRPADIRRLTNSPIREQREETLESGLRFPGSPIDGRADGPGAMALTRIRSGATSWARLRIIIMIPPLDAA